MDDEAIYAAMRKLMDNTKFDPPRPGSWDLVLEMNTPEDRVLLEDGLARYDVDEEC